MKLKNIKETYIVYNSKDGRILSTYSTVIVGNKKSLKNENIDIENILPDKIDKFCEITGVKKSDLKMIKGDEKVEKTSFLARDYFVVTKEKKLHEKPMISLHASKDKLIGDGSDKCSIKIEVTNSNGDLINDYNGKMKIQTTRGRLSNKGGEIEIKKGIGKISLRSTDESVSRVDISAICLDGGCQEGRLQVEFV